MKNFLLFVWQLPQNLIGLIISIRCNKHELLGIKFYSKKNFFNSGVSLGKYIILDEKYVKVGGAVLSKTVKHELGHSVQSKYLGLFYLLCVGVPSLLRNIYSKIFKKSNKWYYSGYPEKWADVLGCVER